MTSSYRNRTSPLEGGYDRKAKDLESHRKSWIADATGAVKDWKSSASATAKLQDYVDQAELQQFKQTKKYIDNFMQKTVVGAAQEYWSNELAKGREMYANRYEDEAFDNLKAEVDELELKGEERYREIQKRADELLLEEDKKKVRSMSHFEQMGYARAKLEDAANNFGNWRENQFKDNDTLIRDRAGNVFKLNEYWRDDLVGGREAASAYLYEQYYLDNKGTFNSKYLTTNFIPKLDKIETAQENTYYEGVRKADAQASIELNDINLNSALESNDPAKIQSALETHNIATLPHYNYLQSQGALRERAPVAWRNNIMARIKAVADANPDMYPDGIIQALEEWKVPGHPGGSKSMMDLFEKDGFSKRNIRNIFLDAQKKQAGLYRNASENQAVLHAAEAKITAWEYKNKGEEVPDDVRAEHIAKAGDNPFATKEGIIAVENNLNVTLPTRDQQRAMVHNDAHYKLTGTIDRGRIEALKADGLSDEIIKEFEEANIVVEKSLVSQEMATANNAHFAGVVKSILKKDNVASWKPNTQDAEVINHLLEKGITDAGDLDTLPLYKGARLRMLQNEEAMKNNAGDPSLTWEVAVEQQRNQLETNFRVLSRSPEFSSHVLYSKPTAGFINMPVGGVKKSFSEIQRDSVRYATDIVRNQGVNGLYNIPNDHFEDADFNLVNGNMVSQKFRYLAAADGNGNLDSWDMYNYYAKRTGRPEIQKPEEAVALRSHIPYSSMWEIYYTLGSHTVLDRALTINPSVKNLVHERQIRNATRNMSGFHVTPDGHVQSYEEFNLLRMRV